MKADTRLAVIPLWLVVDTKVPSSAVRLYAAMAGLFGGHDRPDPTRTQLALLLNQSVSTVDVHLRTLQEVGAIERGPTVYAHGVALTPTFTLKTVAPEQAVSIPVVAAAPEEEEYGRRFFNVMVTDKPRVFTPSAAHRPHKQSSKKKAAPRDPVAQACPRFEEWWELYPRKAAREKAHFEFESAGAEADADVFAAIMAGTQHNLEVWAAEGRLKDSKRIPHGATGLREKRYADQLELPEPPAPSTETDTTWSAISAEIAERVDRRAYAMWFQSAREQRLVEKNGTRTLTVQVHSSAWILKHYVAVVRTAIVAAAHSGLRIKWEDVNDG